MSGFPYKKVLVVGATSGIGWALAERFIENGIKVIVVGRRQEKLDEFVNKHGKDKAEAVAFDISNTSAAPSFANKLTSSHPDLDCVLLNSGIQRGHNFADPSSIDLAAVDTEWTTNYTSYIHLTVAFLPHLQKLAAQKKPASLIYTTSGLALVPMLRCGNYCATKAALHSWILVIREQLKEAASKDNTSPVKVIEILPPAVQTELHDAKHQPDIKDGGSIGIPLAEFTDDAWAQLTEGKDQVPVGFVKGPYGEDGFETGRQKAFRGLMQMTKDGH